MVSHFNIFFLDLINSFGMILISSVCSKSVQNLIIALNNTFPFAPSSYSCFSAIRSVLTVSKATMDLGSHVI